MWKWFMVSLYDWQVKQYKEMTFDSRMRCSYGYVCVTSATHLMTVQNAVFYVYLIAEGVGIAQPV
jgi:hypothetical protein